MWYYRGPQGLLIVVVSLKAGEAGGLTDGAVLVDGLVLVGTSVRCLDAIGGKMLFHR